MINIINLLKSLLFIAVLVLTAKVIGFYKDIKLAEYFGASGNLDDYLFIFNISSTIIGVWFSLLISVMLPELSTTAKKEAKSNLLYLFKNLTKKVALIISLIMSSIIIHLFDYSNIHKILMLISLVWCIVFFGFLASFYSVCLMCRGSNINNLIEGIPSLIIIIGLFIWSDYYFLIITTSIGFVVYYLVTFLLNNDYLSKELINKDNINISVIYKSLGLMFFSQILLSLSTIIDQFILKNLNKGDLSIFNFSSKIIMILTGIAVIVISRALIPFFCKDNRKINVINISLIVLFLTGLLVALAHKFAPFTINFIYGNGEISDNDLSSITETYKILLFYVPFFVTSIVYTSYFSSVKFYYPIVLTGILGFVVKISFLIMFSSFFTIDIFYVSMSYFVMYLINFIILCYVFWFGNYQVE